MPRRQFRDNDDDLPRTRQAAAQYDVVLKQLVDPSDQNPGEAPTAS